MIHAAGESGRFAELDDGQLAVALARPSNARVVLRRRVQ